MPSICNFENLEQIIEKVVQGEEWKKLISSFDKAQNIYMIGNGGNWAVATHAAADITRLTNKNVISLDSPCYITSLTNDHGYDNLFTKWLQQNLDKSKKSCLSSFSEISLIGIGNVILK